MLFIVFALILNTVDAVSSPSINTNQAIDDYMEYGGHRCDNNVNGVDLIVEFGTDNDGDTDSDDRLACALSCTNNANCVAFNFNPTQTNECYLLSGSCTTHTSSSITDLKPNGAALDSTFSVYFKLENYCSDNLAGTSTGLLTTASNEETDIDCGGSYCDLCGDGNTCSVNEDCIYGRCEGGSCSSCFDNDINGDETDSRSPDPGQCGGECVPCLDQKICDSDSDCASFISGGVGGTCSGGSCVSCDDLIIGTVSKTCAAGGGPICRSLSPPRTCQGNEGCLIDGDCTAGTCSGDICVSCDDLAQNGDETGVDCGGNVCSTRCLGGQGCVSPSDCATGLICYDGSCASCFDGVKNQDETDVDCGGSVCDLRCANGKSCGQDDNNCDPSSSCIVSTDICATTTNSPTTDAPTVSPTNAPTIKFHLPDEWVHDDPDHSCSNSVDQPGAIDTAAPDSQSNITDPITIVHLDPNDLVIAPQNNGQYSFELRIKTLLINLNNDEQYSGWVFFTKSDSETSIAEACEFDIGSVRFGYYGDDQSVGRFGEKMVPLKYLIDYQINADHGGMPITLSDNCVVTNNPEYIVGGANDGKLARKTHFAVHYVQCIEVNGYSETQCEETGFGMAVYNIWAGTQTTGAYSVQANAITDSNIGTPNWSNGFTPADPFSGDASSTFEIDLWLKDYLEQSGQWLSSQTDEFLDDNYRYPVNNGAGTPAQCVILSTPVELQYLLPSLQSSSNITFDMDFIYSPNTASSGNIDTITITGNPDVADGSGPINADNLLFTSCYHAPRKNSYNAHSHQFCLDNGLYTLGRNYIYAGMPYRFFFQFIDNQTSTLNQEASSLLDTAFDFTIDAVSFTLKDGATTIQEWKHGESDTIPSYVEGTVIYNNPCNTNPIEPNEANCPHTMNAFEIFGNSIINSDQFINNGQCSSSPCDLLMSFDLSVQNQPTRRRRMLRQERTVKVFNPRQLVSPNWEQVPSDRSSISITAPSWNTQTFELVPPATATEVQSQIIQCMVEADVLTHCLSDENPANCTDIDFVSVGSTGTQFQMTIGQNKYIEEDVQQAVDDCFSESDGTPLNSRTEPKDTQNSEILLIIFAAIGGTLLLFGIGIAIYQYCTKRNTNGTSSITPAEAFSRFETLRLVNEENSPLRFGVLHHN